MPLAFRARDGLVDFDSLVRTEHQEIENPDRTNPNRGSLTRPIKHSSSRGSRDVTKGQKAARLRTMASFGGQLLAYFPSELSALGFNGSGMSCSSAPDKRQPAKVGDNKEGRGGQS